MNKKRPAKKIINHGYFGIGHNVKQMQPVSKTSIIIIYKRTGNKPDLVGAHDGILVHVQPLGDGLHDGVAADVQAAPSSPSPNPFTLSP